MKPLLIGEAPSKNEVTETPIEGRIGKRLASYAGLSLEDFLTIFDRINLLHERQDTREKGFEFDHDAARLEAFRLYPTFKPGQTVIMLGRRVGNAFGAFGEYFQAHRPRDNGAVIYVVPHPSGINRWWNDPQNCLQATEFMQKIVAEVRE